jgi:hypothetical protein
VLAYVMLTFPTGRVYPPGWGRWFAVGGVVKFIGTLLEILATPGKIRILHRPSIRCSSRPWRHTAA